MSATPTQIVNYIDGVFQHARLGTRYEVDMQFYDRVSAALRLVDELAPELVTFSGADYTRYIGAVEAMRSAISIWNAHGASTPGYANARLGAFIAELRQLLSTLDDEVIPASVVELTFITDTVLRESIREDIAAAEAAFVSRQWKSATVMAGAAIEALLLWKIREFDAADIAAAASATKLKDYYSQPLSADPDNWTLEAYRQVALKLKIIDRDADDLARLAQVFRNLIHPGRARRKSQKCTPSTAYTALAAVNRLVELFI